MFVFEIYMNIPRPPRCRAAGTWPPGSRAAGAYLQKKSTKNYAEVSGGPAARQRGGQPSRPPGRGAAGPGRPAAGRPAPPTLYKVLAVPHPLICLTKNAEKKGPTKKIPDSSRSQPNFGPPSLHDLGGFFISIFFISVFYKNIFSIWKFTEIYPGRPAAGTWQPGSRAAGAYPQKKRQQKIADRSLGTGRPAEGRPPPPGRPAAGRSALFFAI